MTQKLKAHFQKERILNSCLYYVWRKRIFRSYWLQNDNVYCRRQTHFYSSLCAITFIDRQFCEVVPLDFLNSGVAFTQITNWSFYYYSNTTSPLNINLATRQRVCCTYPHLKFFPVPSPWMDKAFFWSRRNPSSPAGPFFLSLSIFYIAIIVASKMFKFSCSKKFQVFG